MAVITDLVQVIASVEGLDEVTVGVFARHVREAGLISQRGRGRNAAKMTVQDAANLLIAVNASGYAKDGPEAVATYRALTSEGSAYGPLWKLLTPIEGERPNFGAVLELLIDLSSAQEGRERAITGLLGAHIGKSDRSFAAKHGLTLSDPVLEIAFHRPTAGASVRVRAPIVIRQGRRVHTTTAMDLAFGSERRAQPKVDRRDTVEISQRSLIAIADVLKR